MKHLFVPYSLALLAKRKGFYEPCLGYYETHEYPMRDVYTYTEKPHPHSLLEMADAPVYQQLVDWFREKHNVDVWAQPYMSESRNGFYLPNESYSYFIFKYGVFAKNRVGFIDYYPALTEALTEAFKLI